MLHIGSLKVRFLESIKIWFRIGFICLQPDFFSRNNCLFLIKLDIRHLWNPEVMLEKHLKIKVEENFLKFWIENFFEQKNRNFRAKKLDFFRNFRSKKYSKNSKKLSKNVWKKSKFWEMFQKKTRFFHHFFSKIFGFYLVNF